MGRAQIVACLTLLLATGCSRQPRIVVGSKNFTEQIILGEILAQQLERRTRLPVQRKFNLGGTLLTHEALVSGALDLYPEYTGTALTAILKEQPSSDADAVFRQVKAAYHDRWRLEWLPPLGFANTFALTVRGETAGAERLKTISDAARSGRRWKLGAGYEFLQRPDGLSGLLRAYGLRIQDSPVTMDLGLLYQALEHDQVDMIAANSTDGLLAVLDVRVLLDDKKYFPPYQCAAVVRESTLAAYPELRPALEELSGQISEATIRRLNHEVDGKRRSAHEVASEFLRTLPARKSAESQPGGG
jgi:glycine betaine/choline ABC-type transport system substrate-binding protein